MEAYFPWPGIAVVPPALEAWSLHHWTTRVLPPEDSGGHCRGGGGASSLPSLCSSCLICVASWAAIPWIWLLIPFSFFFTVLGLCWGLWTFSSCRAGLVALRAWALSSLSRDWTHVRHVARQFLNHRTPGKSPCLFLFEKEIWALSQVSPMLWAFCGWPQTYKLDRTWSKGHKLWVLLSSWVHVF